jgi:hypothetical protein
VILLENSGLFAPAMEGYRMIEDHLFQQNLRFYQPHSFLRRLRPGSKQIIHLTTGSIYDI